MALMEAKFNFEFKKCSFTLKRFYVTFAYVLPTVNDCSQQKTLFSHYTLYLSCERLPNDNSSSCCDFFDLREIKDATLILVIYC